MQEIRNIEGVNNPPSPLEVDMTGIELFDSHDLFMKVVIWQSNINSYYSFLVTNENKGRVDLHFEKYD